MKRMHAALLDLFAVDIPSRVYGGYKPIQEMLFPHEVVLGRSAIKPVFRDGNVSVSAVRVNHGPDIKDAYAYRFDIPRDGTSVVFAGDTAPTDTVVALAQDADILVHEAMSLTGVDILVHEAMSLTGVDILGRFVDPKEFPALRQHLLESHTTTTDVVAIAKRANVRRLVITHYVPNTLPPEAITAEVRRAAADIGFAGEVIGATELRAIPLQA
jgi:ribonuclease BN (tRNA processing enzyme)